MVGDDDDRPCDAMRCDAMRCDAQLSELSSEICTTNMQRACTMVQRINLLLRRRFLQRVNRLRVACTLAPRRVNPPLRRHQWANRLGVACVVEAETGTCDRRTSGACRDI
jgi:hypothetical protein